MKPIAYNGLRQWDGNFFMVLSVIFWAHTQYLTPQTYDVMVQHLKGPCQSSPFSIQLKTLMCSANLRYVSQYGRFQRWHALKGRANSDIIFHLQFQSNTKLSVWTSMKNLYMCVVEHRPNHSPVLLVKASRTTNGQNSKMSEAESTAHKLQLLIAKARERTTKATCHWYGMAPPSQEGRH